MGINEYWIDLKERPPEHDQVVFVWWPNAEDDHCCFKARFYRPDRRTKGHFDTAEFEDSAWILMNKEVTHWMPLPTAPKTR